MQERPKTQYGLLDIEFVSIEQFRWVEATQYQSKINLSTITSDIVLRVSFYDGSFDTELCPIVYSQELQVAIEDVQSALK